jgi:hypothetical protein
MTQTRNTLESEVTQWGDVFDKIEENCQAIESQYAGASFPTSPAPQIGRPCFRTDRGDDGLLYVYTGNVAIGEGGWVEHSTLSSMGLEVVLARGSKSTLDQRLDESLNEDGTLRVPATLNPSQWFTPFIATFVDADEFTVDGDQTDIFLALRRLKINLVASSVYSEVAAATYNAGPDNTTVQTDSVLDDTLASVEYSLFTPVGSDSALSLAMLGLLAQPGSKTTMTGNLTFTDHNNVGPAVYLLDPNGADRNFTPSGTFRERAIAKVKNTGVDYNIYAGALNDITIGPGESADIYYDGSVWGRF